jgi:hypothetical protein
MHIVYVENGCDENAKLKFVKGCCDPSLEFMTKIETLQGK